jgi:type IV pilus assembly protein PilM
MANLRKRVKLPRLLPTIRRASVSRLHRGRSADTRPQELVGLDIGTVHLAAAHVVNNGAKEVVKLVSAPLTPGVVVGGEVRDPAALARALNEFFTQHDLPRRNVRLGLANSRIGVRVIEIAGIEDESQLRNAISFRAHEILPVPPEEAAIDYQVLEELVDENGQTTRRILLVVAYRESVDRYVAVAEEANIELDGVDLEAFALLRALTDRSAPEDAPVANVAVCIGHERTTLVISDGDACSFTRVLNWGGAALTTAISRALKISISEAEKVKRTLSLEESSDSSSATGPERSAVAREAVRPELTTLVRELLSSLRFYQTQPDSLAIGEIVLSGGSAELAGLPAKLERDLGVRVRPGDPLLRVRLAEGVEEPKSPGSVAVAIGLGMED